MLDIYLDSWPFLGFLFACFSAALGACVGSFLNVCIWRIPRDESVVAPRSHCPSCNRLIPWYLNIPILSWLLLRGRCRWCRAPISARYILVEIFTAILFCAVFLQYRFFTPVLGMEPIGTAALIPIYWIFLAALVCGACVDLDHMVIPDSVTLGGMAAGPVLSALVPALHGRETWAQGLLASGIGELTGFGLLFLIAVLGEKIFKKEAMGFGDVKLMGAVGAFLGWQAVLFVLIAGSVAGSVVGVTLIALRKKDLQGRIPFGPYLSLGAGIWVFWGPRIVASYLAWFLPPAL